MNSARPTYILSSEIPDDAADIEMLHAAAFGPGRFARAAFRVREQGEHDLALSLVLRTADTRVFVGSLRMSWISTGPDQPAGLLLGPFAVSPEFKGKGGGRTLMRRAIEQAEQTSAPYILLVGDPSYYLPFGFLPVAPGTITLPGPFDQRRLLMLPLKPAVAQFVRGHVTHIEV